MTKNKKNLTKENSSKKAREKKQLVALENKLERSLVVHKPVKQPSAPKKVMMTELHKALGHHFFPGEFGPQKCPSGAYSGYTVGASDRTVITPYIVASTTTQGPSGNSNTALVVSGSNPGYSLNCWYAPFNGVTGGCHVQFSEAWGGTDTWFACEPQSAFPAKANFRGAKLNTISMTVSTVYASASTQGTIIVGLMPDFAAVDNGTGFNNNTFSLSQLSTMPHAQVIPVSSLATKGPVTIVSHKLGPRADEFLDCSQPFTGNVGNPLATYYNHPGFYVNKSFNGKSVMALGKKVSPDTKALPELTPQQYHLIKYDKELTTNTTVYQAYGDDMMVPFVAVQTIGTTAIQFDVTITRSWEGVIDPATMQQAAGAYGFPVGTISGSKERPASIHKRVNEIAQSVPIIPAPSIGNGVEQTIDTLIRVADKVGRFATSPQTQQTLETISSMFGGVALAMGAL